MTTPPREVEVNCEQCGEAFIDWVRDSINLTLDDFDVEYLEEADSVTCPTCGWRDDGYTMYASIE